MFKKLFVLVLAYYVFVSQVYADGQTIKVTIDNRNRLGRQVQILPLSYQSINCPVGINNVTSNYSNTVRIQDGQSYEVIITPANDNVQDIQAKLYQTRSRLLPAAV